MTNAEKFKEVFGFNLNTLYEEQDYDNDYEEKTFCNQITCVHCPFQFTNACVYHEPKIFWQSEYKEPKEERINFAERIKLVNNAVEKTTAKWKKAIEDIKAEIEKEKADAKNNSTAYYVYNEGLMDAHETDEQIIDKHTKELL